MHFTRLDTGAGSKCQSCTFTNLHPVFGPPSGQLRSRPSRRNTTTKPRPRRGSCTNTTSLQCHDWSSMSFAIVHWPIPGCSHHFDRRRPRKQMMQRSQTPSLSHPASSIARLMQTTADQRSILHGRPPELPLLPWASGEAAYRVPIYIGSEGREQPRRLTLHCRRRNSGERVQPCIFRCPPRDRRNAAPHHQDALMGSRHDCSLAAQLRSAVSGRGLGVLGPLFREWRAEGSAFIYPPRGLPWVSSMRPALGKSQDSASPSSSFAAEIPLKVQPIRHIRDS